MVKFVAYARRKAGMTTAPVLLQLGLPGPLRVFTQPPTAEAVYGFPMSLAPTMVVPTLSLEQDKSLKSWRVLGLLLLFLSTMGMVLYAPPLAAAEGIAASVPPWQVWADLRSLAVLTFGHQVLLRSNHCLSGCRFDRHSEGDSRFIRMDGEEGVVFEESGPGAITRIWMTTGVSGVSVPLDPSIRVRFYLDGEPTPRIDLALPELFDGTVPPFLPPLVGDRLRSSGGNYSYVPIAYQDGRRVSLVGAETAKIWFQFTYHRLPSDSVVASFTGNEDLSVWRSWLANPGDDPWPADSGQSTEGQTVLLPGQTQTIFSSVEPGLINALRLDLDEQAWASIQVRLYFDGQTTVDLSAADLFAIGRGGATPTRSLLLGVNSAGELYNYFPMPYFQQAELTLYNSAQAGSGGVTIWYSVRNDRTLPLANSGLFGATLSSADPATPGADFPLLRLDRLGKWVGLFAELGSVETVSRAYLEGDERVLRLVRRAMFPCGRAPSRITTPIISAVWFPSTCSTCPTPFRSPPTGIPPTVHTNKLRPFTNANPARRWRELDVDLAALTPGNGSLQVSLEGEPSSPDEGPFSEFQYQLWCREQCGTGPFEQSEDWTLMDEVVTGSKNYRATYSIEAGPAFTVTSTGCVTFSAGSTIRLHPGLRVERGGTFKASIE